jgi:ABC-type sugar transport system, permease component
MKASYFRPGPGDIAFKVVLYLFLAVVVTVTLYPFLNILAVSLNESQDSMKGGIYVWPRAFTLDNYAEIFRYSNISHALLISVLRTGIGTICSIFCTCMLAYVLSRPDFIFRKSFTTFFVLPLYFSGGLIPVYMLIRSLGLIGNFMVYILPGLISGWNVIVVRSFMDGLPPAFQESARIDGANDLQIWWRVIMPLCLPVIATISLFIAVGQWNSWIDTFLYANGKDWLSTLQYELVKILNTTQAGQAVGQSMIDPNGMGRVNTVSPQSIRMAITMVATVPILCVYPFIQRYFVTGLTLGGIKS